MYVRPKLTFDIFSRFFAPFPKGGLQKIKGPFSRPFPQKPRRPPNPPPPQWTWSTKRAFYFLQPSLTSKQTHIISEAFQGRKFALIDQTQLSPVVMICNKLLHFANVFFGPSTPARFILIKPLPCYVQIFPNKWGQYFLFGRRLIFFCQLKICFG